ncbi:hypothetical protein [Paraferrimonas sp. SM1919]|uniref:hypothetical protein n=1 Tax=Paraferrimonas sp. SM1919 TaxID=2662263 RepID=UPI0013D7EE28|nr:hypothetical protein [Paraferrimonas sp. SM1919]
MKINKKLILAAGAAATLLLSGCATHPDRIKTGFTQSSKFKALSCPDLVTQSDEIANRSAVLYQNLKSTANTDSAQFAIGLLLFWPAWLFLEGGDGAEAAEYSRLQGDYKAMQEAAKSKQCDTQLASFESRVKL